MRLAIILNSILIITWVLLCEYYDHLLGLLWPAIAMFSIAITLFCAELEIRKL